MQSALRHAVGPRAGNVSSEYFLRVVDGAASVLGAAAFVARPGEPAAVTVAMVRAMAAPHTQGLGLILAVEAVFDGLALPLLELVHVRVTKELGHEHHTVGHHDEAEDGEERGGGHERVWADDKPSHGERKGMLAHILTQHGRVGDGSREGRPKGRGVGDGEGELLQLGLEGVDPLHAPEQGHHGQGEHHGRQEEGKAVRGLLGGELHPRVGEEREHHGRAEEQEPSQRRLKHDLSVLEEEFQRLVLLHRLGHGRLVARVLGHAELKFSGVGLQGETHALRAVEDDEVGHEDERCDGQVDAHEEDVWHLPKPPVSAALCAQALEALEAVGVVEER
mmetsp:Transcript_14294/g.38541  ORF Transcript_14294/g.38541 Transcript_14294/m.38541 type:complete len:335 (+) Transcript_14294:122-1126(+)